MPFDWWNERKKEMDALEEWPACKEGEVWWFNIGKNVGREWSCRGVPFQRPVLILRVFSRSMFWGVPVSTSVHEQFASFVPQTQHFYFDLDPLPGFSNEVALLSHLRLYDNKRLIRKMPSKLILHDLRRVREKVKKLLK